LLIQIKDNLIATNALFTTILRSKLKKKENDFPVDFDIFWKDIFVSVYKFDGKEDKANNF